jgi:hypothetical protein
VAGDCDRMSCRGGGLPSGRIKHPYGKHSSNFTIYFEGWIDLAGVCSELYEGRVNDSSGELRASVSADEVRGGECGRGSATEEL